MIKIVRRTLSAILATAFLTSSASAALINAQGAFEFGSDAFGGSGEINAGDRFSYAFTLDDQVGATSGTNYRDSLVSFSLTADPGNTGSWVIGDFHNSTFKGNTRPNIAVVNSTDALTLQVRGAGFGSLGGDIFKDISLRFEFPSNIVLGSNLAAVANGATLDFASALKSVTIATDCGSFCIGPSARTSQIDPTVAPVPLPASAMLLLLSLGGVVAFKRRASPI